MTIQLKSVVKRFLHGWPSLFRAALFLNRRFLQVRLRMQIQRLPSRMGSYYARTEDPEILQILDHIRRNGLTMFPYGFTEEYKPGEYHVDLDPSGLPFVVLFGRNVYFPRGFRASDVQAAVAQALLEQDPESPHRYVSQAIELLPDDVVALVGASDGIFGASILHQVKRIHLFEPDQAWAEPLAKTFARDGDKVKIVQAFVGCHDSDRSVRLDTYFESRGERVSFIQADIEGGELELLLGAKGILQNAHLRLSLCCYHSDEDQARLTRTLQEDGLEVVASRGYALMWMQVPCTSPYLRKAVLYARRRP